MFFNKIFIFFFTALLLINLSGQQRTSISGKVTDGTSNEVLIGANVLVVGTTIGASTDLDGNYQIKGLPKGNYQLRFSYISYQSIVISDVVVEPNKERLLNVSLIPASTELDEVVITADALKNTEANILKIQKTSLSIVDGMSAELISKNNSSDGTDILKSMTGVTISDGKFAYIRGVGDRYNNTLLNGANLPSTEPEKKSFSYDIIPASVIENVITSKTFTPDQPADFTGGLVQIKTVEFPKEFFVDLNSSVSYNSGTSLESFTTYEGGKTDWLGLDDGTRSIPSIIDETQVVPGNYQNNQSKIQEIGKSFANNWNTKNVKGPFNNSLRISLGDRVDFPTSTLGYIASLSYNNSTDKKEIERNLYDFEGPRVLNSGTTFSNSVMWGGLFNVSYKFANRHKFSFKNMYNQNSENETTILGGENFYNTQIRNTTSLRFVSRTLLSSQLIGEHYIGDQNGLKLDWLLNYSSSKRDEPDARIYSYWKDALELDQPFRFLLDQSYAYRFFSNLQDQNFGFNTDFKFSPFQAPELPNFKVGFAFDTKEREFDARFFGFKNKPGGNFMAEDSILQGDIEDIFASENFNSSFIEVIEVTKPSDTYKSGLNMYSGYFMFDASLLKNLKLITGVRYEVSNQKLETASTTGDKIDISPEYKDFLPSIALTYFLTENINLRAAFSKTLARPEFRELAPFSYYDFISNESVQGNPDLKRTLIQNYDLRFEVFPAGNELIAVSAFYKIFENPIEQVLIAASQFNPVRSFANADKAHNYGIELEVRQNLSRISNYLDNFSVVGNLSLINSKIEIDNKGNEGFQESSRPMQGQADFIMNAGLYYENLDYGFSSSVVYNKVGEKIAKAGFAGLGDVIEKPRDQIDLSVTQKIIDKFSIKFTAKDVLSQDHVFIQRTPSGDKIFNKDFKTNSYSISLSYQF